MADGLVFAGVDEHQHPTKAVRFFEETNAVTESFFDTSETELIGHRDYQNRPKARTDIFEYIEAFYNRKRRHSALGHLSPAEYEARYSTITDNP